ncbi:MAG: hypothetical protein QGG50_06310 [Methanopyri archaeon]|jgi:hypothetical protein|nr:hypothetical protein [Methanopyri archaeon]
MPSQEELRNWISTLEERGHSRAEIRKALIKKGVGSAEVAQALSGDETEMPPRIIKTLIAIIFLIMVTVLIPPFMKWITGAEFETDANLDPEARADAERRERLEDDLKMSSELVALETTAFELGSNSTPRSLYVAVKNNDLEQRCFCVNLHPKEDDTSSGENWFSGKHTIAAESHKIAFTDFKLMVPVNTTTGTRTFAVDVCSYMSADCEFCEPAQCTSAAGGNYRHIKQDELTVTVG